MKRKLPLAVAALCATGLPRQVATTTDLLSTLSATSFARCERLHQNFALWTTAVTPRHTLCTCSLCLCPVPSPGCLEGWNDHAWFTASKARPEPADSAEEADCTIKLGQPGACQRHWHCCQDIVSLSCQGSSKSWSSFERSAQTARQRT